MHFVSAGIGLAAGFDGEVDAGEDAFPIQPAGVDLEDAVTVNTTLKIEGINLAGLEIGADTDGFVKFFNSHRFTL